MGELVKLLIEAYKDSACTKQLLGSIKAMINPSTYSKSYAVKYTTTKERENSGATQIFTGMEPTSFTLDLLVDGTGIVPIPQNLTVDAYISKLRGIVYNFQGTMHRPNYLKVTWGAVVFVGVCEKIDVTYKLFNPDGSALRAEVKITFAETKSFVTKVLEAQKSSPDLTHVRTVKAGDTLPLMTYRIYGDSSYYMEVARINSLSSIHAIKPGDQLYFPPLKKA
jgi:LysM repeat protein